MGSNEQLIPVQCMHIVLRSLCFLFFFLAFLVEIWCSAKHVAVSIAMLIDFLLLFYLILHVLSLLFLVYACS